MTEEERKITVLDHGFVRLVESMGSDLSIARNARVSYNAAWRAGEDEGSDARLIRYLYRNGHNTPFESVVFTFEVKAPIFVFRQWHRHRTWSFNEVSARYKELPQEFYVPSPEIVGAQSKDSKQSRDIGSAGPEELRRNAAICGEISASQVTAFMVYKNLLAKGAPRELARTVLPVSIYSHMFATVNLNNLFKFLRERLHPHAQYEIQVYASALKALAKEVAPVSFSAFEGEIQANEK